MREPRRVSCAPSNALTPKSASAKDGVTVDGTSIMGLMMLAAGPGASVFITARGPQAREALEVAGRAGRQRFRRGRRERRRRGSERSAGSARQRSGRDRDMIRRLISIVGGVGLGLVASQFPEYAQQYEQRLGGAVDELRVFVEKFDASAASRRPQSRAGARHLCRCRQHLPDAAGCRRLLPR